MLKAKDFRKYAREALAGKWLKAGAVGVLASMLGATIGTNSVSVSGSAESETLEAKISELFSLNPEVSATVVAVTMGVLLLAVLWAIAVVIIGGATTLGYAKYNLNLVDGKVPLIVEYKLDQVQTKVCELGNKLLKQYKGAYCIESFHPLAVKWYR